MTYFVEPLKVWLTILFMLRKQYIYSQAVYRRVYIQDVVNYFYYSGSHTLKGTARALLEQPRVTGS